MKLGFGVILATLSKMTRQISVFGLSVILARWLSLEDYGTYLHAQLIMNVAFWAFMAGIPHSIYFFLPKSRDKHKLILSTVFLVVGIGAMVCLGVIFGIDFLSRLLSNPNLPSLAWIIAGITFFAIPASIFEPLMISADKVSTFIKVDFFFSILFFFAVFIPVTLGENISVILVWTMMFYALQTMTMLIIVGKLWWKYKQEYKQLQSHGEQEKSNLKKYSVKEQLLYSFPIGLSQGVFELAKYLDKIIVSYFFIMF